ncbi:MAG: hypothetical protein U1F16_04365 [Turneriella sp.]
MSLGQLVAAELIVSRMLDILSKFGKYFENFYDISDALLKLRQLTPEGEHEDVAESERRINERFASYLGPSGAGAPCAGISSPLQAC